jgi:hypothetical protein
VCCHGRCALGFCSEVVGVSNVTPNRIALDPGHVYWTDSNGVGKFDFQDHTQTELATGQNIPQGIAVTPSAAYWTDYGLCADGGACEGGVQSVGLDGGVVYGYPGAQPRAVNVVTDATSVYWGGCNEDTTGACPGGTCTAYVASAPLGGGTPTTLYTGTGCTGDIAVDATYVYWTDFQADTVLKLPIAGGPVSTIASGQAGPWAIAVDATAVYWSNEGTAANNYTDGTILKSTLVGGVVTTLATGQENPVGILLDGTNVYWWTAGTQAANYSDGVVASQPLAGGPSTTIVADAGVIFSCAVAPTALYCAEYGGLMRIMPK